jgi:steroid 5-alpha reductase family enzyme
MDVFFHFINPITASVIFDVLTVALVGLFLNQCVMIGLWFLSLFKKDVSIVDIYWGAAFILLGAVYAVMGPLISGPKGHDPLSLIFILTCIWGGRLTVHLWKRNSKLPEDRRYTQMRIGREKYFGIWSLGFVFLFQGLLSWWISLPVAFAQSLNWLPTAYGFQWNIVTVIGLLVWVVGFSFETIGDRQLVQFKKNPDNRGKVMDQGLWKYTRHPNYFGDACLWWGFWIMSVGASGEFWFLTLLTVLSPVTMTFFLLNVSGVSMLEKDIGSRRPKYSDYIQKTSAFFPWPPKK